MDHNLRMSCRNIDIDSASLLTASSESSNRTVFAPSRMPDR